MNFFEYFHKDTKRTFPETDFTHMQLVLEGLTPSTLDECFLLNNIRDILIAGVEADCIKSRIFYKKTKDSTDEYRKMVSVLPDGGNVVMSDTVVQLIHGLTGIASENAELATAILKGMTDESGFDTVNIKEEIGDIIVYAAVIGNALGFTLEEAMKANIAKRAKRFPNGFTEFDAVNRNTVEERKILEENH